MNTTPDSIDNYQDSEIGHLLINRDILYLLEQFWILPKSVLLEMFPKRIPNRNIFKGLNALKSSGSIRHDKDQKFFWISNVFPQTLSATEKEQILNTILAARVLALYKRDDKVDWFQVTYYPTQVVFGTKLSGKDVCFDITVFNSMNMKMFRSYLPRYWLGQKACDDPLTTEDDTIHIALVPQSRDQEILDMAKQTGFSLYAYIDQDSGAVIIRPL